MKTVNIGAGNLGLYSSVDQNKVSNQFSLKKHQGGFRVWDDRTKAILDK